MSCIFCRIVAGEVPATKLVEDDETIAIMDVNAANDGHALVIAKGHGATLYDLPEASGATVMRTAPARGRAIRDALNPEGLNLLQANGAEVMQSGAALPYSRHPRAMNDGKACSDRHADRIRKAAEHSRAHKGLTGIPRTAKQRGLVHTTNPR